MQLTMRSVDVAMTRSNRPPGSLLRRVAALCTKHHSTLQQLSQPPGDLPGPTALAPTLRRAAACLLHC